MFKVPAVSREELAHGSKLYEKAMNAKEAKLTPILSNFHYIT